MYINVKRVNRYIAFSRMAFLEFMAYPAGIFIELVTSPLIFIGYYFFFQTLSYQGLMPKDYTLQAIITYYSLGWLLRMILNQGVDGEISAGVLRGSLIVDLLKPVNYHYMLLAKSIGRGIARCLYLGLPGLLFLVFFVQGEWLATGQTWLIFSVFLLLGYLILFEIQFFIGSLAFYITVNTQVSWSIDMLIRLVSGLVIPLHYFPKAIADFLYILPFKYIYYLPLQYFIHPPATSEWLAMLVSGLVWILCLFLWNKWFYARAIQRFIVYGG